MIFSSSSFAEADLHVGGDAALLEDGDGGGRQLIGDEYAGCGHGMVLLCGRHPGIRVSEYPGSSSDVRDGACGSWVPDSRWRGFRDDSATPPWRGRPWLSAKAQSSQGVSACDVGRLDRRAAPDAQRRRAVAMAGDVVGGLLLGERRLELLDERPLRLERQLGDRRIGDLQAHRGVGARRRIGRQVLDPRRLARSSRTAPWRWRRRARSAPSPRRCSRPRRACRGSPPRTAWTAC